jgi:hypothetical protein
MARRAGCRCFFYEVDSWQTAQQIQLAEDFALWEFLTVDVREAEPLRTFPRYIPCAITALAAHLQVLRREIGTFVHIAANGGYRSPSHAFEQTRFHALLGHSREYLSYR